MNAAAWQPTRTAPLQRLVVVAAAVTLGRGDVAILGFVVLARRRRLLLRFAVTLAGKFRFCP
jgi:hypothetical protein